MRCPWFLHFADFGTIRRTPSEIEHHFLSIARIAAHNSISTNVGKSLFEHRVVHNGHTTLQLEKEILVRRFVRRFFVSLPIIYAEDAPARSST
jgi:hypothetical protein